MLRKTIYPKVESIVNPLAEFLNDKGFAPNQLTLGGLVLNLVAGLLLASGAFFLGGLVLMAAALGDMLDGALARVSKQETRFGAFLDSTVDRYSDFFIFGGLAVYFAKTGQSGFFLLMLGIILGSFVTSYAKARAENMVKYCSVGFFERAERIILIATGTLVAPLLPFVLWILFLGTNATAIHRIIHTKSLLEKKDI